MVGNNTPVFFIKDPMKFQHFIRSQKRRADNNLRDHDMQWDFWTLSPESAHQVTWLMGDRGIPRTWRHMNGYSSHTYMWVNATGQRFWVKYHFMSDQGVECFTQEEADPLVSTDPDYHTRDLFEAIAARRPPQLDAEDADHAVRRRHGYRFNPFDLTKVWPHGDYPLVEVGRMTLDRNPTDHHSEIEQFASEPSNMVPGIGPSPDKMLLGRMFSYADAHRYRIGTNYNQLPVNAPIAPVNSYSKDGAMRYGKVSDPVYAPNSKGGPQADSRARRTRRLARRRRHRARRLRLHAEDDDWGQAGTLVRDGDGRRRPRPSGRQHRRPPARRGHRAGAATGLRVLAQRRRGPRRAHREIGHRRAGLTGSAGISGNSPGELPPPGVIAWATGVTATCSDE